MLKAGNIVGLAELHVIANERLREELLVLRKRGFPRYKLGILKGLVGSRGLSLMLSPSRSGQTAPIWPEKSVGDLNNGKGFLHRKGSVHAWFVSRT